MRVSVLEVLSDMPSAPKSVCNQPGCTRLAPIGETRCVQHHAEWLDRREKQRSKAHRKYNSDRPASDAFYRTERWKKKSEQYRKRHPLCEECESIGLVVPSQMTDHIKPYRLHPELAFDDENLRALCWPCHNRIGAQVRKMQAEGNDHAVRPAGGNTAKG